MYITYIQMRPNSFMAHLIALPIWDVVNGTILSSFYSGGGLWDSQSWLRLCIIVAVLESTYPSINKVMLSNCYSKNGDSENFLDQPQFQIHCPSILTDHLNDPLI